MKIDENLIRLIITHAFGIYFLLMMIPLQEPKKRNTIIIILFSLSITLVNAFLIFYFGLSFYIRFYFLTLTLPHIIIFLFLALHKGAKMIFALLSVQVISNFAIINGLLASYLVNGEYNAIVDTISRIITYAFFLPITFKFIRPTYLKMAEMIHKGWWILNTSLILSYALAYFILFVPDTIFDRPEYFVHAYIGIFLSFLIYSIIYYLFIEIQIKMDAENEKQMLSYQVSTLAAQSAEITTIAYQDSLTGVKNRYSLFRQMDQLIQSKQHFLVVFIDLDNLKEINDTYDHSKGDLYLKNFAKVLRTVMSDQGEIYRFAGDEFICLVKKDIDSFDLERFRNQISLDQNHDIPFLGASLGFAKYPNDGLSADDLINLADQAMYLEKKEKKIRR